MDTADAFQLKRLVSEAKKLNVPVYINTARSKRYCDNPDRLSTNHVPQRNHHCLVDYNVPKSKYENMNTIREKSNVKEKACCVLIDDRADTIQHITKRGYTGIRVDEKSGIQKNTVDETLETLRCCASSPKMRGGIPRKTRNAMRTALLVVIAVLVALYLFLL